VRLAGNRMQECKNAGMQEWNAGMQKCRNAEMRKARNAHMQNAKPRGLAGQNRVMGVPALQSGQSPTR
jgi:hypothetical protein